MTTPFTDPIGDVLDSRPGPDDKELAAVLGRYDPKAVRRAARRGAVRSSLWAGGTLATWLVVGIVALTASSGLWFHAGGLRRGYLRVANDAIVAAHPDYEFVDRQCCAIGLGLNASARYRFAVRRADGTGSAVRIDLHQDVRGRYRNYPGVDASTPVMRALRRGRPLLAATRTLIAGLPARTAVLAIVEWGGDTAPKNAVTAFFGEVSGTNWAAWPVASLGRFPTWSAGLHASDAHNLAVFGLAEPAAIRRWAAGRPSAYLVRASPADLLAMLALSSVTSANVADVGFDLILP